MAEKISPYIREGSGLKRDVGARCRRLSDISPYIREGSGLKHFRPGIHATSE